MAQATMRQRGRGAPGRAKWLALVGVGVTALVLTFALGVLVGRQGARHPQAMPASVEPAKKPAVAARRSGLSEPPVDRPAQQEKLTFYQTLTAPLGAPPAPGKPNGPARPVPASAVAAPATADRAPLPAVAPPGPARADKGVADHAAPPATPLRPDRPAAERPPATRIAAAETRADWVVQVGSFRERNQAESVRRPLSAAGFDVYVLAAVEGRDLRYKVRLGGFKTREEAVHMAQRLKQERSLAAFVAPR